MMSCYTRELLILFRIMISLSNFTLICQFVLAMVQVEPNRYLSDLSSSSEESLGRLEESETSSRSTRARVTRCHKLRIKLNKCMEFFLKGGGHVPMMMRQ